MLLGQHGDVFGMGELAAMCRHVWSGNEYCACGSKIHDCAFWGPTMRDWLETGDDLQMHTALQKRIEPMLSPARWRRGRTLDAYLEQTHDLLTRVASAAGVSTLVDSSKMPGRGFALAASPMIDLRVVHVVRDGRAVAHSMTRAMDVDVAKGLQKRLVPRPGYRTAIRWRLYNQYAEKLGRVVGDAKFTRVRYEDFTNDPVGTLEQVSRVADLDVSDLQKRLAQGTEISAQHQMAGSRIRMSGPMRLREDTRWRDEITAATQTQVTRIAGAQLKSYGYT